MNDAYKKKLPFVVVTSLFSLSVFLSLRGFLKYLSLWLIQLGYSPWTIPLVIGNPLHSPLHIEMFFSFATLILTWLLSTRVSFYKSLKMRITVLFVMIFGVFSQLLWHSAIPIVQRFIPFLVEKKNMLFIENLSLETVLLANIDNVMLFVLAIPLFLIVTMSMWLVRFCNSHWEEIVEEFKTWEYTIRIPRLVSIFMDDQAERAAASQIKDFFQAESLPTIPLPDVELGVNTKTGAMVVLKGKDRTLNNVIIGAIGTGKTAALVLPMINQDLHHMTFMINNFEKFYNQSDYHSEDIKGSLMNGISIIEPSKDLCDNAYELIKAHGIPEEAVYYIDPTNPETPSLNLFNQPVEKVAEMFSMVISGIGESQEYFFEQSQRTHLKSHIYLLMLHDPEKDATFDDLIDMYNEPQLVAAMHQALKKEIKKMEEEMPPEEDDDIRHRDKRNHMKIIRGIDEWFNESYIVETAREGGGYKVVTVKDGPHRGQPKVYDAKAEHVVGLRNVLNDIASNILLRRVLFGKSTFDFDLHLEYGGILLVNTAKGELAQLSDVLGKFCLLSLQNAVFRRKPNTSPYHHIVVDEFPDYLAEDFKSFPAQSRKYKAILTVVAQTVSQLSYKYGQEFRNTLMATLRNKYLYGDTTQQDAEMFSALFGEKTVFEESENDMEVSPLQESPMRRTGQMYTSKERAILTPNEVIHQDAFQCAVKLVKDNKPLHVQQIKANFVPREEFKVPKVKVEKEAGAYWLNIRAEQLKINHSQPGNEQLLEDQSILDELPTPVMDRPLGEVNYGVEELVEESLEEPLVINQAMFEEQAPGNQNSEVSTDLTPVSQEQDGRTAFNAETAGNHNESHSETPISVHTGLTETAIELEAVESESQGEEGSEEFISFDGMEIPGLKKQESSIEPDIDPIFQNRHYGHKSRSNEEMYQEHKDRERRNARRVSKVDGDKHELLKGLINDEEPS